MDAKTLILYRIQPRIYWLSSCDNYNFWQQENVLNNIFSKLKYMAKLKVHFRGDKLISNDKVEYTSFEIAEFEKGKRKVLLSGKPATLMLILNYGMKALDDDLNNTIAISSNPEA